MSKIISEDLQSQLLELRNELHAAGRLIPASAIRGILLATRIAGNRIDDLNKEVEGLRAAAPPTAAEIRAIVREEIAAALNPRTTIRPLASSPLHRALARAVAKEGAAPSPFPYNNIAPQWPELFETKGPLRPTWE